MPQLDVSELLTDPDFADCLVLKRQLQTMVNGLAVNQTLPKNFIGVVTSSSGQELDRGPDGERLKQKISVITKTRLMAGRGDYSADIVTWNEHDYTVVQTNDYSRFGQGFIEAVCEQISMRG